MAYWPGMIEPGQDPVDILHITDLFATAGCRAWISTT